MVLRSKIMKSLVWSLNFRNYSLVLEH
jgi:hypothetical protein